MPAAKAEPGIEAVAHLQDGGDIGAGAEERGMAERILPAVAAEDVPALAGQRDQQRHHQEVEHRRSSGTTQRHARRAAATTRTIGASALHARAPNRPLGRTSRTRMKIRKMPIWPSYSPRNRPHRLSTTPMSKPPISAPGDRAHAAQHDDGEGDQHEGVADVRIDVIGRDQQAGRDREAGGAEAEGDGVDMRDVDADQFARRASPWRRRGSPCRCRSRS